MKDAVEQLRSLVEELDEALESGDWDRAVELDAGVRPVVDEVASGVEQGSVDRETARDLLERLRQCSLEIVRASENERNELARELKGMQKNRTAAKAYGSVKGR